MMATDEGQRLLRGNGVGKGDDVHDVDRIWVAPIDVGHSMDIGAICQYWAAWAKHVVYNLPDPIPLIPMWNFIILRSDNKYIRFSMPRNSDMRWDAHEYIPYKYNWGPPPAHDAIHAYRRSWANKCDWVQIDSLSVLQHIADEEANAATTATAVASTSSEVVEDAPGGSSSAEQPQLRQDADITASPPSAHSGIYPSSFHGTSGKGGILGSNWTMTYEHWRDPDDNVYVIQVLKSPAIYKGVLRLSAKGKGGSNGNDNVNDRDHDNGKSGSNGKGNVKGRDQNQACTSTGWRTYSKYEPPAWNTDSKWSWSTNKWQSADWNMQRPSGWLCGWMAGHMDGRMTGWLIVRMTG